MQRYFKWYVTYSVNKNKSTLYIYIYENLLPIPDYNNQMTKLCKNKSSKTCKEIKVEKFLNSGNACISNLICKKNHQLLLQAYDINIITF